jgi:anti-sigma factor RsiW
MNCQEFQNQVHEFVEGSFSAAENAEAERHLEQCSACRALAQEEQQAGHFLAEHLDRGAGNLTLRPEIRQRILSGVRRKPTPIHPITPWNHLTWPLGLAATVAFLAAILWIVHARTVRLRSSSEVSIDVSYRVPVHEFRMQGDSIVDEVSIETVVINETLPTSKPAEEKPKQKVTL